MSFEDLVLRECTGAHVAAEPAQDFSPASPPSTLTHSEWHGVALFALPLLLLVHVLTRLV